MERHTTGTVRHGTGWSLLLCGLGACTGGADPDPRAIARELGTNRPNWREERVTPVVASIDTRIVASAGSEPGAMPAPQFESRALPGNAPTVRIAVGREAAHVVDSSLLEQFAAGGQMVLESSRATDRDAVAELLLGKCDFAVLGSALAPADVEAGLQQTMLGVELFALAVAQKSALRSLSRAQVRSVLAGQVTTWSDLGCEGGHVTMLVPADRAVRDRAAMALIPGDPFSRDCVPFHDGELARQLQRPGAVAVVRVTSAPLASGVKLLQVDWTPPTRDAFAGGFYPFGLPVVMATAGEPTAMASNFVGFARSDAGKSVFGSTLLAAAR